LPPGPGRADPAFYPQTAADPLDGALWYVGDYLKAMAAADSMRVDLVRLPGCRP
jgi:hypothetical protein